MSKGIKKNKEEMSERAIRRGTRKGVIAMIEQLLSEAYKKESDIPKLTKDAVDELGQIVSDTILHSTKESLINDLGRLRATTGFEFIIKDYSSDKNLFKIIAKQSELKGNGFILSKKDLIDRGKKFFQRHGMEINVLPIVYVPDWSEIEHKWLGLKIIEYDIKPKDLVHQLNIDKATISQLLSDKKKMTKFHKTAFFYFFKLLETSRNIRDYLNQE